MVGAARQARAGAEIPSARFGVIFELMIVIGSRDSLLSIKVKRLIELFHYIEKLFTPPARRAWRSFKFAPFLFFFSSMSKVGPPLMGDTAGFPLLFSALLHII